jgi:hypothetical protein
MSIMQSSGYLASVQTQINFRPPNAKFLSKINQQLGSTTYGWTKKDNLPINYSFNAFCKRTQSFHESSAARPASATQIM